MTTSTPAILYRLLVIAKSVNVRAVTMSGKKKNTLSCQVLLFNQKLSIFWS